MNLIEWINGVTKLNKSTMDNFQNNIKNAIEETEAKSNGKCFYLGGPTLTYLDSTTLSATVTIEGLSKVINQSMVIITCLAVDGTPYGSITNISYKTSGDNLTIYANAPSFAEGHVLAVKILVYYNG